MNKEIFLYIAEKFANYASLIEDDKWWITEDHFADLTTENGTKEAFLDFINTDCHLIEQDRKNLIEHLSEIEFVELEDGGCWIPVID